MKGESFSAIVTSIVGVGIALASIAFTGCTIRQSPLQPASDQAGSNSSPPPVVMSCKSPDVPPADVANKPGYRQFDVSVTNSIGWPVSGLKQQDFVLYAGSQTFPVAYFREHKNDEPVAIALVVDTSGSMAPKLPFVRQPLGDFVKDLSQCDEVSLFAFDKQTFLLTPFSADHRSTAERMQKLDATGSSALYDATNTALRSLEGANYPNRKLILIADGMDNSSATPESEAVARATTDGIPIYAVGIGDPNVPAKNGIAIGPLHLTNQPAEPVGGPVEVGPPDLGMRATFIPGFRSLIGTKHVEASSLEDLSAMTGGRSFIVPMKGEVGETFQTAMFAIADNINKGYTIGVVIPSEVTPSTVKVTVVKRPGLNLSLRPTAAPRQHD